MRPDASENSQISPSTIVRAARAPGSQPHLASGFQGRCKIATLHAGFGVIRGMSVKIGDHTISTGSYQFCAAVTASKPALMALRRYGPTTAANQIACSKEALQ